MSKISVLIPTYNRQGMIREAIRSIQEQTHQDFEIIIVDDGSTDGTEKSIRGLSDSRIIYSKVEHRGVAAARNTAMRLATSKVACWQDSDDLSSKYRLERMLKFLNKTKAICVGCSCKFFKEPLTGKLYHQLVHTEPGHLIKKMGFASAMFLIDSVPHFLEELVIGGEDAQWLGQIRRDTTIPTLSDVMYHVRYHIARITHQRKDPKNRALIAACNRLRRSS